MNFKLHKLHAWILGGMLVWLSSCMKQPASDVLSQVLILAGENRVELEKVLSRYEQEDRLKYEAACFLIENMPWYYYYEGEHLDHYLTYFRLLRENKKTALTPEALADSILRLYGRFTLDSLQMKYDLLTLDSAYICHNIDWAFKVWREQPWGKNVSFDDFCEYILPYRIDNEKPEYWRESFYNEYNDLLESLRCGDPELAEDPIQAVWSLMPYITHREEVYFTTVSPSGLPHIGASVAQFKSGSCRELTDYAVYVCRALGIPCHIDFVPVRGNDNVGHFWISYPDKNKELYIQDFPEGVSPLLTNPFRGQPKPKVYRHTFSCNWQMKNEMDALDTSVPELFARPMFIDVTYPYTKYYMEKMEIPVSRLYNPDTKAKIAYLCISQHLAWAPVAWTPVTKNQITFRQIQKGDIMRIATWENKQWIYQSDPFRMDPFTNRITYFSGRDSVQDVVLYTKFDIDGEAFLRDRMLGGVFEGSDQADFSRKDTLFVIHHVPDRLFSTVMPNTKSKPSRHVRYYGPPGSHCNVSEVAFYEDRQDTLPLAGKIIGTPGSFEPHQPHEYTHVYDGKTDTSFDYKDESKGWAGLDLGTPKAISRIVYTPRNRDNYVRPGDKYELFYLDKAWKSLGSVMSEADSLVFKNVPKDALLYLKNHSRGSQERIFTYENGKQIWW